MADLPFLSGDAGGPPAVSRPAAKVKLGGATSSSSGFGGIVDAAASLLTGAPGDPWREHLLALRLRRVLAPEADLLQLLVAATSTAPAVALGDQGELSMTSSDGTDTLVFTGKVDGIHERASSARLVTASNGSCDLALARLNRSFEQQDTGQIIQALASELGLSSDVPSNVPTLPRFVIDDRLSLYAHIANLAALSGYLVSIAADGGIAVKDPAAGGEPAARITYGIDVLDFRLGERAAQVASVQVTGEGAAGDQGSDAWYWLRKDPASNQSTAGSGAPLRTVSIGALRSADAVATLASAKLQRASEVATRGWLVISGTPQIEPGDNVELSGMPQTSLNGSYRVDEIVHEFDARRGFRSRLGVINAGAAGAASGLAGLVGGLL
jgi:phage protein D